MIPVGRRRTTPETRERRPAGNGMADLNSSNRNAVTSNPPGYAVQTRVIDFRDRQLRGNVERLHRAGWRPFYELLIELGAQLPMRTEVEETTRRYAQRLDPKTLVSLGTDRWSR